MSTPGAQAPGQHERPVRHLAARAVRLGWDSTRLGTALLVGLTLIAGAAPPAATYLSKLLFDELALGRAAQPARVTVLAGGAALAAGVVLGLSYLTGYLSAHVQQRTKLHAETRLYERVNALVGIRLFEDPAFHNRLLLAERAVEQAPSDITAFVVMTLQRGATTATYLGVLVTLWPPMAFLLAAAALPALLAHRALARRQVVILESTATARRRHDYYARLCTESRSAREIRVYGLTGLFQDRLLRALGHATFEELLQTRKVTQVEMFFALLNALVVAAGTIAVARGLLDGSVTLGSLVFFLAAVSSVQAAFGGVITQFGVASTSLRLFDHYLDVVDTTEGAAAGGRPVLPLTTGIVFRDVWFRYGPTEPWVLTGLNLTLEAGKALGVVGENGAGKSTLVKLLLRFYEPEAGEILWDGQPLRDLDALALRRRVGVVFQDYVCYELTAAENIGVGDVDHLSDVPRVREAARLVEMEGTLDALRRGFDTMLGYDWADEDDIRGATLSGGQWQRVALARSLMRRDSDLLVLDEPTANLDPRAEHRVHELLRQHRLGRTSLLVSHRLNALRGADHIVVLAAGKVTESGSHDELMHLRGVYAQLFALQASGYQDERVQGSLLE